METKTQQKRYLKMIEDFLQQSIANLDYPEQVVVDAMKYSLLSGGKRVRGVLVLAFCELLGTPCHMGIPVAGAVEMIHAYSLIHDDLPCMDDDDIRRGKPACHIMFGEANALLAGDGLLTLAFQTIAEAPNLLDAQKVQMIQILSKASGYQGMIGGQVIDLSGENKQISLELLSKMHEKKTGALIQASCQLGEIAANKKFIQNQASQEFGKKIGLAFQVRDDILDVIGEENTLGKPIGSDVENQKSTYVSLLGLEKAMEISELLSRESKEILQTQYGEKSDFLCSFTDYLLKRNI